MMACTLTNDGPVTLQVDSRKYSYDAVAETKGKSKAAYPSPQSAQAAPSNPSPSTIEPQP